MRPILPLSSVHPEDEGSERSDFIQGGEFLNHLNDYQFSNDDSTPWISLVV